MTGIAGPAVGTGWWRVAAGAAAGMMLGMGLGRFSYTAMVPPLVSSGELTALAAGRVGMVNIATFALGALASVGLRNRLGERTLLPLAAMLSVIALAGSALPLGPWWLAVCRGTLGITAGVIMVLSAALVTATAPDGRRPLATGIMFAGVGVGVLLTGALVPWLLGTGLMAAWLGLAAIGAVAAMVAIWGWLAAPLRPATTERGSGDGAGPVAPISSPGLVRLMAAHAAFSFAIVPHTLYWVDFVARGLGHGMTAGGWHWSVVGIASILGPGLAAVLAIRIGTAWALPIACIATGLGIGLPLLTAAPVGLFVSSALFGAQPGLSALMAARARDLAAGADMARVMRAMILANSAGGISGGLLVPELLVFLKGHTLLFGIAGAAMMAAGILALPAPGRSR